MNREQRKRITQNITSLKERLIDLDPILDILIERDVLTMEHRNRIEQINQPTSQRKFNEFISILLGSPEPTAYQVFIEALQAERHFFVVEKLQNTIVKDNQYNSGRNTTYVTPSREARPPGRQHTNIVLQQVKEKTVCDGAGASGAQRSPSLRQQDLPSQMTEVLAEFCEKINANFAVQLEKERHRYQEDMEIRLGERLDKFQKDWIAEKQDLLQRNEEAITHLQDCVDKLQETNMDYKRLREKYEKLKNLQYEMREKENERWQKLTKSNMDNVMLRKENENLRQKMEDLQDEITDQKAELRVAKDNENQDRLEIERLTVENRRLERELEDKEREKEELKREVQETYAKIQTEMTHQRETTSPEEERYKDVLERQNTRLDEIYAVVSDMKLGDKTAPQRMVPRSLTVCTISRGHKSTKK